MRVEAKRQLPQSRSEVWAAVSDPGQLATWFDGVSRWAVLSDEPSGLGARWDVKLDVGAAPIGGVVEVVEFDPLRDLAFNSVTGVSFRSRVRLRGPEEGPTTVTLRLAYQAPGGLLGLVADRVAAPLVRRTLRRSLSRLRDLLS